DTAISSGELELDPSIGYSFSSGDVTYDIGVLQYGYPEDTKKNFTEVYGSVAYAGAKLGVAYSPDFYAETGKSLYTYVSYGTEVAGFGVS
ncbi:TorF family putative porin, partial [Acinetobacter baumannii]